MQAYTRQTVKGNLFFTLHVSLGSWTGAKLQKPHQPSQNREWKSHQNETANLLQFRFVVMKNAFYSNFVVIDDCINRRTMISFFYLQIAVHRFKVPFLIAIQIFCTLAADALYFDGVASRRRVTLSIMPYNTKVAQLSQRALQGGLVIAKSGRLELEDNILQTLQVCLQPL